jgi:hypothetical protein
MKKYVLASVCALALLGLAQQRASAWCNFNFSAGINLGFQSGGWERSGNGCGLFNRGQQQQPCCVDGGGWGGGYGATAPQYYPLVDAGTAGFHPAMVGATPAPANAPAGAAFPPAPLPNEGTGPKSLLPGTEPQAPAGYQPVGYSYEGYNYPSPPIYWNGR